MGVEEENLKLTSVWVLQKSICLEHVELTRLPSGFHFVFGGHSTLNFCVLITQVSLS
jgi:hypothetical protein